MSGIPTESQPTKRRFPAMTVTITIMLGIYWTALFYGTHTKIPPGMLPGNSDKWIHVIAYTGLGMLFMSLRATRGSYPWVSVFGRWIVLSLYGAFDELTQLFVNRSCELRDWFADVAGAALGLGVVTFVLWCFRKNTKPIELTSSLPEASSG